MTLGFQLLLPLPRQPPPFGFSLVDITNLIEARGRIDCRCRMLQVGLDASERVQLDGRPHPVQCLNEEIAKLN